MFSRLDPYFTATMRHAESADARLEIRRDEQREQEGRKNPKEKKDDPAAAWDDSTVVSVRALQTFLESLIADQGAKSSPASPAAEPPAPRAQAGQAAHAARAYQTTARVAEPLPTPPPAPSDKPVLTPEEIRTIHRLIADLKLLADSKVEHLHILRSESFLQSLVDAAARARNAL